MTRYQSGRYAALILMALAASGCLSLEAKFLAPPHPMLCRDGRPLRILQHPECTNGICGYTCQPDRWKESVP
jgi:hypothetical protein